MSTATTVLLYATLAYVAILVLALAVGLIAITYFLNKARVNLAKIAGGLVVVDKNVEPLENALTAAENGLVAVHQNLEQVESNLAPLGATLVGRG
ncbi:MAG: hypothetical protein NVS1B11_31670 [Terriglobales bacterium]